MFLEKKINFLEESKEFKALITTIIPFSLETWRKKLISEFNLFLKMEEDFWKLKLRINWINEGDANTKFFHTSTLIRRWENHIISLKA